MPDAPHSDVPVHEEHFESLARQSQAARFGMWVFLSSEALLFAALFALYAGYHAHWPAAFREGVRHNDVYLGSTNTVILIVSSFFAAFAVHALEVGRRRLAVAALFLTLVHGAAFLGLKGLEYVKHIGEGMVPGGGTPFFVEHATPGLVSFVNLYYLMTALHALHVVVGMAILGILAVIIAKGRMGPSHGYRLEVGVLYWHLVDAIWIFLWPMFYLMGDVQ
ncbi:MAG: cytochrome c oxidase subunit 3 [Myxococcota bacterium]